MTFSEKSNHVFWNATQDYHKQDDVDAPMINPFPEKTIEYDLYHKNWIDAVQWHLEDIVRDPEIDPVEALSIKRRIDKSNQDRTDLVERMMRRLNISSDVVLNCVYCSNSVQTCRRLSISC